MLSALRADRNILGARLFDNQGQVFAEYRRADLGSDFRRWTGLNRLRLPTVPDCTVVWPYFMTP